MSKRLKETGLNLCGHPDPGVPHTKTQPGAFRARVLNRNIHHNLTLLGEFDGIAQQVHQNLPQSSRISAHDRRCGVFQDANELKSFPVSAFGKKGHQFLHHVAQIKVNPIEFELTGFDFGKIQNVINQSQQGFA